MPQRPPRGLLPLLLSALLGLAGCFKDSQGAGSESSDSPSSGDGPSGTTSTTGGPTTAAVPTTGTGGTTGTVDTTTSAPCPGEIQTLPPARASVVLVIDRSGAMKNLWDHDGVADTPEVTFWSSMHAAVSATLTDYQDRVDFGAGTSPASAATSDYSASACLVSATVEVPVGQQNRDEILGALPAGDSTMLAGADPIAAALGAALTELDTADPALPRQIVLISNGLAQCHPGDTVDALFEVYDPDAPAVAAKALAAGIPVHVVGLGLSDTVTPTAKDGEPDQVGYFEKYAELATAGGTAPFVDATTEAALLAGLAGALDSVAEKVEPCVVALDVAATTPEQTRVDLAGEPLALVEDCASESGWHFLGALPYASIELCGAACAGFQKFGAIDVLYCEQSD